MAKEPKLDARLPSYNDGFVAGEIRGFDRGYETATNETATAVDRAAAIGFLFGVLVGAGLTFAGMV